MSIAELKAHIQGLTDEIEELTAINARQHVAAAEAVALRKQLQREIGDIDAELIDEPGDEGQLFGRTDWPADADRVVGGRLTPRINILKSLGKIEIFKGIVYYDAESRTTELFEVFPGEPGGILDNGGIEGRVIPPGGRNLGLRSHFSRGFRNRGCFW